MTACALGREELGAVRLIRVGGRLSTRAAAGREHRGSERESDPGKRTAQRHYAGGALPVVPSCEIASSRVG